MFKWLNKQGVESSAGYVLQSMHRFYYHYTEGEKTMQVFVEPLTDEHGHYSETVDLKSLDHWLPPHADVSIDDAKRQDIRKNISDALDFMDIDHHFA